jgi:hypothetical protein
MIENNISKSVELGYLRVVAPFLIWQSSIRACVSTKSPMELGSRSRIVACKRKLLLVKYIYIKKWM